MEKKSILIGKYRHAFIERNSMFLYVFLVFILIPFELWPSHGENIPTL